MNFGGKSKPKGTLAFAVIRAHPQPSPIDRLIAALKGALAKWQ
jgi:hypothetical protein